jgi:hypothetical protein
VSTHKTLLSKSIKAATSSLGSYAIHIKAMDMHVRQMLLNMGPLATGGAFTNQYRGDVIRKSRARNDKKKESVRTRQLHDHSYRMDEPIEMEDSVPIVLDHYLKQLHAACVALPLLNSMRDTPEVFLTALHEIAVKYTEQLESESSKSWASVLSSASVLQGSPYKNLVNQLFIIPFKSRDAFQIQEVILGKLSHDMMNIKNYVLPYAKDSEHHTLKRVSVEVDRVELFMAGNTEHTSGVYNWNQVLMGLKIVTENAITIHINHSTEFGYNNNTLQEGVLEKLSNDAEDLGSYPDEERFTPSDAVRILEWRGSDLGYEEILASSSPAETLHSQHSVDELFSTGTNYDLTLPIFKCKVNVQRLRAMGHTMASKCYDILHFGDFTEEADVYLAEFKNVLMSNLPGVCKIGVRSLNEVHGLNVIKLSLEFVGLGEVQDLYTYMTIPLRDAAKSREPIYVMDVNLLSVRKQGAGMVRMLDDNFLVDGVLGAVTVRDF